MPRATRQPAEEPTHTPLEYNAELEETETAEVTAEPKITKNTGGGWADDLFAAYDDTEEHLNVLYWGREGSGKTIDLATATTLGRVLFINAEAGLKKRALLANGVNTENLVVFPRPGQPLTYRTLEQALYRVKSDLMDDPKSWFLVAVDSITELAQAFTDEASGDRFDKAKRNNSKWEPTISDEMFTDLSDYGTSTKMVRKAVRLMRDLPVHVAITALERRDVDEDTSKVAYGPAVGPALQTSLLGYVDVVLYTKAPDEQRDYFRAQTKKVGAARAKDRIGVIPKVLVNPTFPRLLAYNEGTLSEDTDPVQEALTQDYSEPKKPTASTAHKTRTRKPTETTTVEPALPAD